MKKTKKTFMGLLLILIVMTAVAFAFYSNTNTLTSITNDNGIGLIETKTQSLTWLGKIFIPVQQTSILPQAPKVGDTVNIMDISTFKYVSYVKLRVYKDNVLYSEKTVSTAPVVSCSNPFSISSSFKIPSAGTWKFCYYYNVLECGTPTMNWEGTHCDKPIVVENTYQSCPSDFCAWSTAYSITNGKIQDYICQSGTPPNCVLNYVTKDHRTYCNSGYVVTGTNYNFKTGISTCTKEGTPSPDIPPPQSDIPPNIPPINTPPASQCVSDEIYTCPNQVKITSKYCINGEFVDSDILCQDTSNPPIVLPPNQLPPIILGNNGSVIEDDTQKSKAINPIYILLASITIPAILSIILAQLFPSLVSMIRGKRKK